MIVIEGGVYLLYGSGCAKRVQNSFDLTLWNFTLLRFFTNSKLIAQTVRYVDGDS